MSTRLLDEETAVESYLNALLQEATEAPDASADVAASTTVSVPDRGGNDGYANPSSPAVDNDDDLPAQSSRALVAVAADNADALPDWAQKSFQILLFEVGGLPLAVPLAELNGIQKWTDDIKPLPGHSPWFLGLLNLRGKHVKVVDPYLLVVPQHRQQATGSTKGHIVFIDDNRWGLVCDKVSRVLTLATADVQWRSARTKRPWLLGTVKEQMCAVLDVQAFADMLENGRMV